MAGEALCVLSDGATHEEETDFSMDSSSNTDGAASESGRWRWHWRSHDPFPLHLPAAGEHANTLGLSRSMHLILGVVRVMDS